MMQCTISTIQKMFELLSDEIKDSKYIKRIRTCNKLITIEVSPHIQINIGAQCQGEGPFGLDFKVSGLTMDVINFDNGRVIESNLLPFIDNVGIIYDYGNDEDDTVVYAELTEETKKRITDDFASAVIETAQFYTKNKHNLK